MSAITEVEAASRKLEESRHLPQFTLAFRTAVYSTQLAKLKNVDDPILLEIVEVYSDLSSLDAIVAIANQQSMYVQPLTLPEVLNAVEKIQAAGPYLDGLARVGSACRVLLERLRALQPPVHTLVAKLPGDRATEGLPVRNGKAPSDATKERTV